MFELEPRWEIYLVMAVALASVHVWFRAFSQHSHTWDTQWLGLVGGIATGYVVLYMLPKLSVMTAQIVQSDAPFPAYAPFRTYLMLLSGIVVYLIMERLDHVPGKGRSIAANFDYLVHAAYNFLVGYVVVELPRSSTLALSLATAILLLHLMSMTHILRQRRAAGYDRVARWLFLVLVLCGSGLALLTELPKNLMHALTAFVGGIILVNVISQELPIGQQRRLPWFLAGVAGFIGAMALILNTPLDSLSGVQP